MNAERLSSLPDSPARMPAQAAALYDLIHAGGQGRQEVAINVCLNPIQHQVFAALGVIAK